MYHLISQGLQQNEDLSIIDLNYFVFHANTAENGESGETTETTETSES